MMSVDILPTALPLDASKHFSKEFYPYLRTLVQNVKTHGSSSEWKGGSGKDAKYNEALERATIASCGQLRENHQWLQPSVDKWHHDQRGVNGVENSAPVQLGGMGAMPSMVGKRKKMLMFGSGMVAGPAVQEIAKRGDTDLVIGEPLNIGIACYDNKLMYVHLATNMLGEAQQLAIRHGQEHNNVKYRIVDVGRKDTYEHLVKEADVVIRYLFNFVTLRNMVVYAC
jgi:alpha-aminoadipic semialdehyde synthase